MPIITPAYPSMCATFNISRSSMTIINRELRRGLEISESIMLGKRPWSDLFVKHTFFTSDYKYYISVTSASKTKEAHNIWSGYVESKVRVLVQKLEQHPSIALAHVFVKGYERRHSCNNDEEIALVQDGNLDFLLKEGEVLTPKINSANTSKDADVPAGGITAEATAVNSEAADSADIQTAVAQTDGPTEVFTTTHYIGIELDESEFYDEALC